MFEYFGAQYVPVEPRFFADPSVEVAPRLIGCVFGLHDRGKDTAIMFAEVEAYHEGDGAAHGSVSQLLPHGHAYVHGYGNMWCIDLVCGAEGQGSSVLIRAGVPVVGIDIMAERRSEATDAARAIRERANGYEKKLCNGPATWARRWDCMRGWTEPRCSSRPSAYCAHYPRRAVSSIARASTSRTPTAYGVGGIPITGLG